jgi:hypothetical protein
MDNPGKWTRNCEMVTASFLCSTATYSVSDGLFVHFKTQRNFSETILVAKEHDLATRDEGYINHGYTKLGIYVCTFYLDLEMQPSLIYSINRPASMAKNMLSHNLLTKP